MSAARKIVGLACAMMALASANPPSENPDELYRRREDLASAARAADLWAERSRSDYEAAWKLSRVCYWLGTHLPDRARRSALDRGVTAGETAIRLEPNRPEGHFWLAASMGTLAESFGLVRGLTYRGRIKAALQRAIAIDASWQGGSAEAALGQWYYEVPRVLGGSPSRAEEHLRRALAYDSQNLVALSFLAGVLASGGRRDEARGLLQRVLDAPISTEWGPEDRELKRDALLKLESLGHDP